MASTLRTASRTFSRLATKKAPCPCPLCLRSATRQFAVQRKPMIAFGNHPMQLTGTAAMMGRTTSSSFGLASRSRGFSTVYAKSHEWLKVDGDNATLGISDYAQDQLGEVVYAELPSPGATFSAKDTICTLESVKAVGEVYAPLDCEVVEVNTKLEEDPGMINKGPEGDGWLLKIKLSGGTDGMMDKAAYDEFLKTVEEH